MKSARHATALLATAAFLACAGVAPVTSDYDTSASFDYRTWAWLESKQEQQARNPWIDEQIRAAIDEQLAARGFRLAQTGADFRVGYHVSRTGTLDARRINERYGYPPTGWKDSGHAMREFDVGTLIIDIVDSRSDRLVWRGWAARRLPPVAMPEQTAETIRSAVAEILEQFPPQPKGESSGG